MNILSNKNILVGVTSSIAAYKVVDTIREIKKEGANVKVILTENATHFVSKLVLETFLEENVYTNMWQNPLDHIKLARWCDAFLITPLSANTLCKISAGIADNLLTNVFLACNKKKFLAPAMNTTMLESNAVQRALKIAIEDKCKIIEPENGLLACNEYGKGHIASNESIIAGLKRGLSGQKLLNKNIVITGGGTFEDIDPVRTISNKSTGYFAVALAKACYFLGANVTLIAANVSCNIPSYIKYTRVENTKDMLDVSLKIVKEDYVDCYISAAAISDYFVKNKSEIKVKKQESYKIELGLNEDVVKTIANLKNNRPCKVVGFCAETLQGNELAEAAKNKLDNKNLDFIVANEISAKQGFGNAASSVFLLGKNNNFCKHENASKDELAYKIIDFIF